MPEPLEVTVTSTDQKLGYTAALRTLAPVTMDYIPPFGSGQGYLPLELLLMSLAACSGGALSLMLKKMGKTVAGVKVTARGIRKEQHPTGFRTITLVFQVTSPDADELTVQKAIPLAESVCPVWSMLQNNAEIKTEYKVVPV